MPSLYRPTFHTFIDIFQILKNEILSHIRVYNARILLKIFFHSIFISEEPEGTKITLSLTLLRVKIRIREVTWTKNSNFLTVNSFWLDYGLFLILNGAFIISVDTRWDWFQRTYVVITAWKKL